VVTGELLGFTALMAASFIASRLLAEVVPLAVIGWLGLMPIVIGLANLAQVLKPTATRELIPVSVEEDLRLGFPSKRPRISTVLRDRQTYKVSAITISNGGNNLSIYIPLLATSNTFSAMITILICYLSVIAWLVLSFRLTRLPGIAIHLSRYAGRIFPFVLMWLGIRILHDSGALALLR
jgi:cadmium resistance protein CadD (predicted permease)